MNPLDEMCVVSTQCVYHALFFPNTTFTIKTNIDRHIVFIVIKKMEGCLSGQNIKDRDQMLV